MFSLSEFDTHFDLRPQVLEQLRDELLSKTIDINNILIDPAPFQLVERTSLYKVHSLFSILALTHAYVTSIGRLVGVVTLTDVSLVPVLQCVYILHVKYSNLI